MPDTLEDRLIRQNLQLNQQVDQMRAQVNAAHRAADREWNRQDAEIRRLRAELDARHCPTRVILGRAISIVGGLVVAAGLLGGAIRGVAG